jgi:hypothetical protein
MQSHVHLLRGKRQLIQGKVFFRALENGWLGKKLQELKALALTFL